jgi:hypothetical protein
MLFTKLIGVETLASDIGLAKDIRSVSPPQRAFESTNRLILG